MGRPSLCSAAAVMENTVFTRTLADLWNTCPPEAFVFYLNYLSCGCVHYGFFFFFSSCNEVMCKKSM